jgi:hypothetical protein
MGDDASGMTKLGGDERNSSLGNIYLDSLFFEEQYCSFRGVSGTIRLKNLTRLNSTMY